MNRGGRGKKKIRGQRTPPRNEKEARQGFYFVSRLSGNRKRLRARKSFVELVGEISIFSKSMK